MDRGGAGQQQPTAHQLPSTVNLHLHVQLYFKVLVWSRSQVLNLLPRLPVPATLVRAPVEKLNYLKYYFYHELSIFFPKKKYYLKVLQSITVK